MKGYEYLKKGLAGDLEPKTIIKTEHISEYESFDGTKDYDYYIFENDNMFHRCNKNGKLGAKYQDRFLNYKVLNKEFEMYCVLEEEKKIPEKLDTLNYKNRNTISVWNEHRDKINEIIDYLKSKGE